MRHIIRGFDTVSPAARFPPRAHWKIPRGMPEGGGGGKRHAAARAGPYLRAVGGDLHWTHRLDQPNLYRRAGDLVLNDAALQGALHSGKIYHDNSLVHGR